MSKSIPIIEIYFSGSKVMRIKDKTFQYIIGMLVSEEEYVENPPLKLKFLSTGKTIYWHQYSFQQYYTSMHGPTMEELVERFQCDNVLRNNSDIATEHEFIDEDSLWMLRDKTCILVDSDQYVEITFEPELFYDA